MNEEDWMTCDNPHLMMTWLQFNRDPSRHQMRMFSLACCWESGDRSTAEDADRCIKMDISPASRPHNWAMTWCSDQSRPSISQRANVLRDVMGNPFRPHPPLYTEKVVSVKVTPEMVKKNRMIARYSDRNLVQKVRTHPDWLTHQVTDLANIAYADCRGPRCEKCKGKGGHHAGKVNSSIFTVRSWVKCDQCEGNSFLPGVRLDPLNLMVLADCMEESGCSVGQVIEYNDGGTSYWYNEVYGKGWPHLTPSRAEEHPILSHLRSPETHFRGCWALDLILGKD